MILGQQFEEKYSVTKDQVPPDAEQKKQLYDYCPKAQLKNPFQECGSPMLSFKEENHLDGTVTIIPIDENNTKAKIMEKIDHFVEE